MRPETLKKVRPGDPITAVQWNALVDFVVRNGINAGQSTGLDIQQTPQGTAIRVKGRGDRYLAQASANIPAASGAAPGAGTVYLVLYDGTNMNASSYTIDVLNPSATTMTSGQGIDSGQKCWIEQDTSGYWWVCPLECA